MDLGDRVNVSFLGTHEWLKHTQVPNADLTLIITGGEEEARLS